ncbi:hypothetical protein PENTCL1PPCAC_15714, partial [Pristionchus entomophagus]
LCLFLSCNRLTFLQARCSGSPITILSLMMKVCAKLLAIWQVNFLRIVQSKPLQIAINDNIYFLYQFFNDENGFAMYRLNKTTLDVHEVKVICEDVVSSSMIGCVLTDDKRMLMWIPQDHTLYEGKEVGSGFKLRQIKTTGEMPHQMLGFAHGLHKGCLIIHGGMSNPPFFRRSSDTFELNLKTMEWRKRETTATKEIKDELATISNFSEGGLIVGDRLHAIDYFAVGKHFILDLPTNTWTRVEPRSCASLYSSPPDGGSYGSNKFVCDGKLYLYSGRKNGNPAIVYRLDEEKEEWINMLSSDSSSLPECYGRIAVAGSRIYLSGYLSLPGEDATLVSVLETNPSLFDSSAAILQKSREGRALIENQLPPSGTYSAK